ncbi:helix-turn-helix transcriptional regulator [Zavarzinella formosa]|uniref:helix-turn-helix transcriptional regulator n=1 Tax=Zavarzinella formosa TaxID=360055 RepID=UPI00031EB5CE|nr:helix-turn-helix transcriptional regulator [Zavarzinella formosa]
MKFAEKLREMRSKAGLSQSALARKAGVGAGTIHALEQGKRIPTFPILQMLSRALEGPMGVWDGLEIEATPKMLAVKSKDGRGKACGCPAPDTQAV